MAKAFTDRLSVDLNQYDPAVQNPQVHRKVLLRAKIAREIADPESLLGTTADAVALALIASATIIRILRQTGKAQTKDGLAKAFDGRLAALAEEFLTKLDSGEIEIPALNKGLDNVLLEFATRTTGVARVLKDHDQPDVPKT